MDAESSAAARGQPPSVTAAWVAWGIFYLIIAGYVLAGTSHTVTPIYRQAALNWFSGKPLYTDTGGGFIYLPQAILSFAPFAALPPLAGDLLWRLLTVTAYAYGVRTLADFVGRRWGVELFPAMTYLCIPLAWQAAVNGQATLPVTALMILSVVELANRRWWRATLWLILGLAVKPMITFLLLLAAALYRPMRARLLAGIAVLFVTPFLLQSPRYVIEQYRGWSVMLQAASDIGPWPHLSPQSRWSMTGPVSPWPHFFGLLETVGIVIPPAEQTAIRVVAATLTLVLCMVAVRKHCRVQGAVFLLAFHACFLTLFSPRTEPNSYSVVAPAIAVLFAQAWVVERRLVAAIGLAVMDAGIARTYEVGRILAPDTPPIWLAPLMCLCFFAYAVNCLLRPINHAASATLDPA